MMVSGFTDSRLNDVKTYNKLFPYQLGVNGVTNIIYDTTYTPSRVSVVEYIIDDIFYKTNIISNLFEYSDLFVKTQTTYYFDSAGCTEEDVNNIKQEVEMGISEPPKVESEIFIERQSNSVFERQLRMGEITTLEQLGEYRNGYYNIFNLE